MTTTASMSTTTLPQSIPQSIPQSMPQSSGAAVQTSIKPQIQFVQKETIQADSANFSHQKTTQSRTSSAVAEPLLPFMSLTSEFRVDNFDVSQLPEIKVPEKQNIFSTNDTNQLALMSSFATNGQTILDFL